MDEQTILEMIGMIADMETIHICEIEKEGVKIRVEKAPIKEHKSVSLIEGAPVREDPAKEEQLEGFSMARDFTPTPPEESLASPGRVKYARDMMQKEFGENDYRARDFLAHVWELPIQDVPPLDTWDSTLTRSMAGAILDYMESNKRNSKFSQSPF